MLNKTPTVKTVNPEAFPFLKPLQDVELNFIQKYILNRKFVKTAIKEAEIRAFPKALEDLKETNVYDTDEKAKVLAKQMVNDMLSPVDLNKIVTLDKNKGIVFIGGIKADEGRLSNLKAETEFLLQSDLWTLLHETPKELAQRSMFVQGETLADMQKGKSILYTLSTQNNILLTFKSFQVKKPNITPATP